MIAHSLIFTEDGHKFYLKALYLAQANKDNPNPAQ